MPNSALRATSTGFRSGLRGRALQPLEQPAAFAETAPVKEALGRGMQVLPLVLVGDRIAVEGSYPSRETLAALAGVVVKKLETAQATSAGCCGPSTGAKSKSSCC